MSLWVPNPKARERKLGLSLLRTTGIKKFLESRNDEVTTLMDYNTFHKMYNIWKREAQSAREKSRSQRLEYHLLESINSKREQQRAKIFTLENSSIGTTPIFIQPISDARLGPNVTSFSNRDMVSTSSNPEANTVHQVLKDVSNSDP